MQSPVLQSAGGVQKQEENDIKLPDSDSQRPTTPPLPTDCEPLSHQVAGHVHGKGKTKIGMLQYKDGTILKPFQRPSRGQKEALFYQRVFSPDPTLPLKVPMETLQPFIPCYYGTVAFKEDPNLYYLKLEDVTKKYRKPCIMDVKIGCQTYEDSATQFKKENAKIKYPNMLKVGFQISGMRIYYANSNKYEYYDKSYGRHFEEDTVIEGLKKFFQFDENFQFEAVTEMLYLLYRLEDWFVHQNMFHFISSSILFVYEGDKSDDSVLKVKPCDSIPKLVPKNYTSKANEVFDKEEVTTENGIQNSWYVDHFTGKPIISESVLRPNCLLCDDCSCSCEEQQLPNDKMHTQMNKCNNGFSGDIILLDRIKNMKPNGCLENKTCFPDKMSLAKKLNSNLENEKCENDEKENGLKSSNLVDLKMIDFTHVIEGNTRDNNYLFGLRKLIQNLEVLKGTQTK
ncbi:inositol polyphosphate multikinase-like [Antedon mediterranea]|uniref:inositol polyphosphate multikinase-like n=1 Tax=Antedon mediterranea TaxID=105859 RepID=UPI003AF7D5DC